MIVENTRIRNTYISTCKRPSVVVSAAGLKCTGANPFCGHFRPTKTLPLPTTPPLRPYRTNLFVARGITVTPNVSLYFSSRSLTLPLPKVLRTDYPR